MPCPVTKRAAVLVIETDSISVIGPTDGDPERGRGIGKSKLIDIIANELANGFVNVSGSESMPDIKTRLLSSEDGRKRVVRLDNVKTLRLSWADLEGEITSPVISGKALYKGEGRRPNTLVWLITLNGASLSKDMALRTIPIKLDRPVFKPTWESDVRTFIRENRQGLLGDIRKFLEMEPCEIEPLSRWTDWDRDILSKLEDSKSVQAEILNRQRSIDNDDEEQDIYREFIAGKIKQYGADPVHESILIPSATMTKWVNELTKSVSVHGAI